MAELTDEMRKNARAILTAAPQPTKNPTRRVTSTAVWPLRDLHHMSCHPSQVDEFNAKAKADGFTGVEFEKGTGACIFSTRGQRKAYCEARGYFDRSGGYGDPQPNRVT